MIEDPWDDKDEYQDKVLVGVDSVGNGALAGPIVACACVIDPTDEVIRATANDSKKLSESRRQELETRYRGRFPFIAYAEACPCEITRVGPYRAALTAMGAASNWALRLVEQELPQSDGVVVPLVIVDGKAKIPTRGRQDPIAGADGKFLVVGAASIMAKVYRDSLMHIYDVPYPHYQFRKNKGYGTPAHLEALRRHGPCRIHRRSFRPVALMGGS